MSDESEVAVKVSKGDIVKLEYEAWAEDTGEMFDTTSEETAQENGIFNENAVYGPITVLVGAGRIFEGLEEALEGVAVGEEKEVVIPPDKAAGQRDPKLMELHPIREFHRKEIQPQVGMEVNINNRVGTIVGVTAGRVRVDFNRPLAGKSLKYKFKVVERIEKAESKIRGIVEMDYGNGDSFNMIMDDEIISLIMPDVCKYDQKWIMAKYRVVADLREVFGNVTIRFVEEYPKKEETSAEEEKAEEEKAEEELEPEKVPLEEQTEEELVEEPEKSSE
jgi:FKBP-type peptidyl-prolyl cis-trans isomerase 2